MVYVGIDLHKRYSRLTTLDKGGEMIDQARISNDESAIKKYLTTLSDVKSAAVEATGNWYWLMDLLEDTGIKAVLSHPAKTKAIASAKIKTDKLDSKILADLLRVDLLPCCYVPDAQTRDYQERLRYRAALVKMKTSLKNRVHATLAKNNIRHTFSDLFGKAGRDFLSKVDLPAAHKEAIASDLKILEILDQEIDSASFEISQLSSKNPQAELLKTIPGIGSYFSLLIMAEIGDINRFACAKKLCGYASIIPSTHSSGGLTYHGRITRTGSKWLRWALVEAANCIVRRPGPLRDYYLKLTKSKGTKIARVAVARKLLSYIYHMLKQNQTFEQIINKRKSSRVSPCFPLV